LSLAILMMAVSWFIITKLCEAMRQLNWKSF
jgi:hypothetical protein